MKQELGYWQQTYVDHLRAGYRKITRRLCIVKDGYCHYCALGLMAEIAYQNGFCQAERGPQTLYSRYYFYDSNAWQLSDSLVHLFRLRSPTGSFQKEFNRYNSLSELNDLTDITFPELADLIERNPANFFTEPA